jgi:serpin B
LKCLLLLSAAFAGGCGNADSGKSGGIAADGDPEVAPDQPWDADEGDVRYVIARDAEFFKQAPLWHGHAKADGTFKAGTPVVVKGLGNAYVLVEGQDGQAGYVELDQLQREGGDSAPAQIGADAAALAESNNRFALDLYRQLVSEQGGNGNLFFSPYSISTALAMAYAGARGQTAEEMRKALHFDLPDERLHAGFRSLGVLLRSDVKSGYQLQSTNRLFGQRGAGFLQEFLGTLRENYRSPLVEVDFEGAADQARTDINAWVEKQTGGKIANLVPPDLLSGDTQLALLNALYFQGTWQQRFGLAEPAPFRLSPNEQVSVPTMSKVGGMRFGRKPGLQLVELTFGPLLARAGTDQRLSMVVLLPDAVDGVYDLEKKLTPQTWKDWTQSLRGGGIYLFLPKFRTASRVRLDATLQALGMKGLFASGEADLSGMNGRRDLFLAAALHNAYLNVDEQGVEAAAATVMPPMKTMVEPSVPPEVRVDHPFLLAIRDNRSGSILFMGRIVDPR